MKIIVAVEQNIVLSMQPHFRWLRFEYFMVLHVDDELNGIHAVVTIQ